MKIERKIWRNMQENKCEGRHKIRYKEYMRKSEGRWDNSKEDSVRNIM
jgi:hypothetical protein